MGNLFQSLFLNQSINGGTVLLYAVFLGLVLVAIIFRPRHVRNRELVLASVVFFSAALIVPNVLLQSTLVKETNEIPFGNRASNVEKKSEDSKTTAIRWAMVSGPTLFGISVILGTLAFLPTKTQLAIYDEEDFRRRARES
jgi:hypothetical protein